MNKSIKTRDQIESKYKWNIEAMYPDESQWEEDYKKAEKLGDEFLSFAGSLSESPEKMLEAFRSKDEIWQTVEKVYVYARMKSDEDTRIAKYLSMMDKSQALVARTAAKLSFFTPELLEISEEKLLDFVSKSEGLKLYEHVIRQILRQKAHVLSKAEEKIIAKFSQLTSATNDIFNMINNADIKFGTIEDEEGDSVEVTHGRYIRFMESPVRRVRKDAFERLYAAYEAQKNTLAATYNYNTKTDVVTSNIRKYSSSLEAALQGDNIKTEVYDNLIDVVNRSLPLIHRYVDLRKNALKLDEVHMYDLYAPLAENPMDEIKYEDALGMVEKGLAPLGDDYIRNMKMGFESGWIDVFENEGKRSGAYSFGSYDSMPYILLNYNGRLKDVFTIAHEVGHSMHSYYTRKTQPFIYGGHSIFTAEVASTVNENLLMRDLLEKEDDPKVRKYLLNIYIEDFRATLFRQTMFAEFEKITHEAVEAGEVLTAEWLCDNYLDLNKKYFGKNMVYDPQIKMEWARIPHFYNAFYVYKYATGYSAAIALTEKILSEGESARNSYIEFLKSGESDDPIPLLKEAGVDMSRPDPIEKAMLVFEELLDELERLL